MLIPHRRMDGRTDTCISSHQGRVDRLATRSYLSWPYWQFGSPSA